jgi:aspartyl-tRNA(Asn)/glutamyl-tRNA(Gln) amidotransferase subunit A
VEAVSKRADDAESRADVPLYHLTVAEAGRRVARRELSPVDLLDACLGRIAAVDGIVHSYITVTVERARAAAREAEAEIAGGRLRGPLHGIPFAVKDNYHVAGVRTTGASRLMLDHVADTTATAVAQLEAAGAILLGKLNTWELGTGSGMVTDDLPFPIARNPWDTERLTGGSSTGPAAAVAAGTALFALGSDTGGSIRLPAAACGLIGLKPTYGLVSRAGCLPNCWSLDHNGPLAWTIEDAALVLSAIAGHDGSDPTSADAPSANLLRDLRAGVGGLTIGVVRDFGPDGEALDAAQREAFERMVGTLEGLGAHLVPARLPASLTEYRHTARVINWAESYSAHEEDFLERRHLMGASLREKMMCGFALRAADYLAALRRRRILSRATDEAISPYDAVVLPGAFHVAPRLDEPDTIPAYTIDNACSAFNLTGHPAICVPTGFADGLPLNAQVVGPYYGEAMLLRVAQAYESATPWREVRPRLGGNDLGGKQ